MNSDKHFKSGIHFRLLYRSRFCRQPQAGQESLKAIDKYDGTVAVLANGSLSHRFIDDQRAGG